MPCTKKTGDQHQQQGAELAPDPLDRLLPGHGSAGSGSLLQGEVAGDPAGASSRNQISPRPRPPPPRRVLPGAVQQAAQHQRHGGRAGPPAGERTNSRLVRLNLSWVTLPCAGYELAVFRQVAGEFQPAPGQSQQAQAARVRSGGCSRRWPWDLQPVGRVEDQAQGGGHAEQHDRAQGTYVRHPEQMAGAEFARIRRSCCSGGCRAALEGSCS